MRILSWNILQGGGKRIREIAQVIVESRCDVAVLQEFRHGDSGQILLDAIRSAGYKHQFSPPPESAKTNTVAVFSKTPVQAKILHPANQPETPTALAINAEIRISEEPEDGVINLVGVHLPHKKKQLPYFDSLLSLPENYRNGYSVLIGDFNCGIPFEDSETKTFYATHQFQALLQQGWIDSWRSRHPKTREFTWISTRKGNGFRYDHALLSPSLDSHVSSVEYQHEPRELGYSDHSLILLDFDAAALQKAQPEKA